MFPWLIFGVIAVPLLLVGFMATRRKTDGGEHPASGETLTEKELAEAEAYEAKSTRGGQGALPRGAAALGGEPFALSEGLPRTEGRLAPRPGRRPPAPARGTAGTPRPPSQVVVNVVAGSPLSAAKHA